MTEDEAKTKLCPASMSRQFSSECIASACMAWRWEYAHDGSFNTTLSGPTLEVASRTPNFKPTSNGYCGLAGEP